MSGSYRENYERYRHLVEERLSGLFTETGLEGAMRYSLLAGGKRIRPVLTLAFCEAAGGEPEEALDLACGVEALHTYSLIHDDLPCMDDDDLRRGRPTNHKVYGETTAVLAGDALQTAAFRLVCSSAEGQSVEVRSAALSAAAELAQAAGERGMCLGQYLDTEADGQLHTVEELMNIHRHKTGALLEAACVMGVWGAKGRHAVTEDCLTAARSYAAHLGLAFQIRDDILDVISDEATLGKPIGSDAANDKSTYVTLLGVEECQRRVEEETALARAALGGADWPGGSGFLKELAEALCQRAS